MTNEKCQPTRKGQPVGSRKQQRLAENDKIKQVGKTVANRLERVKNMEMLTEYLAKGFMVMLSISMPCVLTAAAIGLVVGIIQAVTQVQEQTIAAAPKILAVFLVIVIGGIGFIRLLTNLFSEGMALAFNTVPKNDSFVLPADYYKYTTPFEGEMKDSFKNQDNINDIMKNPGKVPYIDKNQKIKYNTAPRAPMPKGNFVEINKMLGR